MSYSWLSGPIRARLTFCCYQHVCCSSSAQQGSENNKLQGVNQRLLHQIDLWVFHWYILLNSQSKNSNSKKPWKLFKKYIKVSTNLSLSLFLSLKERDSVCLWFSLLTWWQTSSVQSLKDHRFVFIPPDVLWSNWWWLFPRVWGFEENVEQFIPQLCFFFFF